MSFSLSVKEELAGVMPGARHCQIAELSALISMCGHLEMNGESQHVIISSENKIITDKAQIIINKAFNYEALLTVRDNRYNKNNLYILSVEDSDVARKILLATKLLGENGINEDLSLVSSIGISNLCCKRAFLRGAFLAGGSISNPEKSYHMEIVTQSENKARQIMEAAKAFDLDTREVERRHYHVIYLKEGAQIVDMLGVMGARLSLMDLENVRVVKEVRNSINRQVNCETANLSKTINAAVKQIEDINYIKETVGLDSLSDNLLAVAKVRLEYPDVPLKDLGEMLSPPVGKSGVNHRLRKISLIAEEIRQKR